MVTIVLPLRDLEPKQNMEKHENIHVSRASVIHVACWMHVLATENVAICMRWDGYDGN